MTPDEFRERLRGRAEAELLGQCLLDESTPYVFYTAPQSWNTFRDELVARLGVDRSDIRIVGSGRLGFSLKPGLNFRGFRDTSDIDVVIVNGALFDQLWISLLEAAYPRPPITNRLSGWLQSRRNELYTGWLTPLEIKLDLKIIGTRAKPVLDFNLRWFDALKHASKHPPRRHQDITGRLYRTWRHAELYHLHSLAELRKGVNE